MTKGVKGKRKTREYRATLARDVSDLALKVADTKEKLALRRIHYEEYNQRARNNLERVKTLHVAALTIEEPSHRARTLNELHILEKEISDSLFVIAEARSSVRRYAAELRDYERRLAACQDVLQKKFHE